jgi:hypothetical protein
MVFAFPAFLWALAAITIPIVIHLFNFRKYKKVYFTNVKFLKELQQESQSKSRLKELLILAARILTIACLVFAFAQPVIPSSTTKAKKGNKHISIYLDNSFSMEAVNKQGTLLDNAKRKAKEIVNAFSNTDRFQIVTNDFEGKQQRLFTKEDALNAIEEVKISPIVRDASRVIQRQRDFLNGQSGEQKQIYLLSDLQRSTFDVANFTNDSTINTTIICTKANQTDNVYIDSCWFESPIQQKGFILKLHATLINKSSKTIEAGNVKLLVNKSIVAISSFSLNAGEKKEIQFSFECKQNGINYCSLKLEDYPITFDDELLFTFNAQVNINTLVIHGKNAGSVTSFVNLMQNDSLFNYKSINENAIDYSDFKPASLIILNEVEQLSSGLVSELIKFSQKGGSLVIIPALKADLPLYQIAYKQLGLPTILTPDTHSTRLSGLKDNPTFYQGVFEKIDDRVNLPIISNYYTHEIHSRQNGQTILSTQNGQFFLRQSELNNAKVYLFAGALSDKASNFCRHALFVPTFIKMGVYSLKPAQLFYAVKTNAIIDMGQISLKPEETLHIISTDSLMDIIPELRIVNNSLSVFTRQQIEKSGFYTIKRDKSILKGLAFNHNRLESDLSFYESAELEIRFKEKLLTNYKILTASEMSITQLIKQESEGYALWKWFIILTLVFLLAEALLIRFLK